MNRLVYFTAMIFFRFIFIFLFFSFNFIVYILNCSHDDTALNTLEIVQMDWSTRDESIRLMNSLGR